RLVFQATVREHAVEEERKRLVWVASRRHLEVMDEVRLGDGVVVRESFRPKVVMRAGHAPRVSSLRLALSESASISSVWFDFAGVSFRHADSRSEPTLAHSFTVNQISRACSVNCCIPAASGSLRTS